MGKLGDVWRELTRRRRVARAKRRTLNRQLEQTRFEERKARHDAGIYERPRGGGI